MGIRRHLVVRAGIVAGLALTALPTLRTSLTPIKHAGAATARPVEIGGFSPSLLSQAAAHPVPMIVYLRHGAGSEVGVIATLRANGASAISSLSLIGGVAATLPPRALAAIRYDSAVSQLQPDRAIQPLPTPHNDTLHQQLALAQVQQNGQVPAGQTVVSEPDTLGIIHADVAQKQFNGRDVRVAIVDTGIDLHHPDLQGVMLKGPDGKPLYKDFTNTDLTDTEGHGTAVAGTIAAQGKTVYSATDTYRSRVYPAAKPGQRFDDRTYFTVTGVAPGVKLMVAKVFDTRHTASDSGFVAAIQWAIANHADVISESWGSVFPLEFSGSDAEIKADEEAVAHGITVVVAAGNSGPGQATSTAPANAPDVIAAGASTDNRWYGETGLYANYGAYGFDSIASFTGRGPTADGRMKPDVYAPGDSGWAIFPLAGSTDNATPPYGVGEFGGTSMATPVTAATAAIVINAYRETHHGKTPAPALVKQILLSTADDLGYGGQDQGAGRVNALRAIQAVQRQGPAVLLSGSMAMSGAPGTHFTQPITATNIGSTRMRLTFESRIVHQSRLLGFGGTVVADDQVAYKFKVPAGISTLTASVNFNSQLGVPLPSEPAKNVVLNIVLYDPSGKMVNWEQSTLPFDNSTPYLVSGFTGTTAGKPIPGLWTAVVSQAPERDKHNVRHLVNIPFKGRITFNQFAPASGTVTPSSVTLAPGQTAHVVYHPTAAKSPGVQAVTIHVREKNLAPAKTIGTTPEPSETLATIPVLITSEIPISHGLGTFTGAIGGGVGTQSIGSEYHYFTFSVPGHATDVQVSIRWQHQGNLFYLTLIDPSGKIVNLVTNALPNTDGTTNLNSPTLDSFMANPVAGKWRIALFSLVSAGTTVSEPFRGVVVLNAPAARLDANIVSVHAGGDPTPFKIEARNTGIGLEGYYTYASTDQYAYMALGGTGGTLQNGVALGVGASHAITYTTNFVPPGTREVITQAQALNSGQPLQVELLDSQVAAYHSVAQPLAAALGGQSGPGYAAIIRGDNLPIGQYNVEISLPNGAAKDQVYVASNTQAYALSAQPWIKMDAQRAPDGSFAQNQTFKVVAPTASEFLNGKISVPDTVAPGTYHAHIYVYTFRDDQIADLPLTIKVLPAQPVPSPTPDALLATIASTQYFPEGVTADGLTDQMDLVNPGDVPAHVYLRLLTDGGWTTVSHYALGAHARKSINVQPLVGSNQAIAAVIQADEPVVSGRLILRNGAAGSYSVGTIATSTKWHFADGYTVGSFQEFLTVVNPGDRSANVHVHLVSDQGDTRDGDFTVGPSSRRSVRVGDLLPAKAVSATITSNVPIVAERTQQFGSLGQGVTTTVGTTAGSMAQYIDPGHLPRGSQAHLSLYNPGGKSATVSLNLIDQHARIARTRTVHIKGGRRATIDLTADYKTADLGAQITSDQPIIAEKVAYFGEFKQAVIGGSVLGGMSAPVSDVVFPGGTTAKGAADYLNLYNPGATGITATVTAVYSGSKTVRREINVAPRQRVSVDIAGLGVPSGSSSLIVTGMHGAQFFATQTIFNGKRTDGSELSGIVMSSK